MTRIRGKICMIGSLLLAGMASLRADALTISTQSPFQPRPGSGLAVTTENTPVELLGILKAPNEAVPTFGFFDTVKRQGGWVKLNEQGKDFPITVRSYDAAMETVSVEYQGRMMNLKLKTSKIAAAPAMAMAGPPRPLQMPGQPAVAQTPSVDDARRLEAVAAEVARRRQARQAAAQQQLQPQPMPPPVPQNQQPAVRRGNVVGGNR